MSRISTFSREAVAGYEPVAVRAFLVAVFTMLFAFGIGTGDLPPQVDAVLTFLAFAVPIAAGFWARSKVSPVKPAPGGSIDSEQVYKYEAGATNARQVFVDGETGNLGHDEEAGQ